jgi:protein Tex
MTEAHVARIAQELTLRPSQVAATAGLLAEGGTVPFIARYRKEATDSLDEVAITTIRDRLEQLAELDKRREAILSSLKERELLTEELEAKIAAAETMAVLEDIYLPFRPKRRTRAMVAREKGLEPLALAIFAQDPASGLDPFAEAEQYVSEEKGVESVGDALAGARDIIAELVSEDQAARGAMRELYQRRATIASKVVEGQEEAGAKFRDYFEWDEGLSAAPSHRILAMFRGEKEGALRLAIAPPEAEALDTLTGLFVCGESPASQQVRTAVEDSHKRLLGPSMETEVRAELKQRADSEAIRVFAENLRELLLAPPLGQKRVLALDPGFRTGCKLVCLDAQGGLIHNDTIYPHTGERKAEEAGATVLALCQRFGIEAVAIGNGTASRETESFVRGLGLPREISIVMVNESGASVYSASDVARQEFPDHDVTVRGAVSIGRRLTDPLAELVKIDPKSIGVGQYQHDVDQGLLKQGLDDVVVSCVNGVGVDVNTASPQLLTYVSGLGPTLAKNIIGFRSQNGPFVRREQLLEVPRLGPKAFEQAAGFLRIPQAANPLDASAVHPESYHIVHAMAGDAGCTVEDLVRSEALRRQIDPTRYVTETVGLPTLEDILAELAKPGRDPRRQFEHFAFAEGVEKLEHLQPGMVLPGIVTNVTQFGAFVDVGVHQDGLVHVSHLADRFVRDPGEVVKVQQQVRVTVLEVDLERNRISLSMRTDPQAGPQSRQERGSRGDRPEGRPTPQRGDPRPKPKPKPVAPQRAKPAPAEPQVQGWFAEAMRKAEEDKRRKP